MKKYLKKNVKSILNSLGYEMKISKKQKDINLYLHLYGKESVLNKRFYNINGGGHFEFGGGLNHPCWTNVDVLRSGSKVFDNDIAHDLLELAPLPIESDSAELVHSQYTIEHITDNAARIMFKEVNRILKSKGVFRIVAPNNELDFIAYNNDDISYFYWRNFFNYKIPLSQASFEQVFLIHFAATASIIHNDGVNNPIDDYEFKKIFSENTFEDAMNICTSRCSVEKQKINRYNHINWWTHKKLKTLLKEAGFATTYILSPGQSSTQVMRNRSYFDRHWNDVALFMEAVKE